MSVQVRRRREAASFLASFVGAQGELLVDTTNNRVQVHDGATPGGFPAAAVGDMLGRNMIINGNFAINQRVAVSGTALAAGVYAHDRWKAGAGGCTYAFTQTLPDTLVTLSAGTLVQVVEPASVYAASCWLTWTGTASARAWQGTASGTFVAGTPVVVGGVTVNALLVAGLTAGISVAVEFGTGTLGLVQLEAALPNAGPTRFERRALGGEFEMCRRYFQYVPAATGVWAPNAQTFAYSIGYQVQMRGKPTLALVASGTGVSDPGTANYAVSAISSSTPTVDNVTIALTTATATSGKTGVTQPDLKISLTAEL